MNPDDDDIGGNTATQTRPNRTAAPRPAGGFYPTGLQPTRRAPLELDAETLTTEEAAGDPAGSYTPGAESDAESVGEHEEITGGGESAEGDFAEATDAEMAQESGGEESAVSDLRMLEGYEDRPARPRSETGEGEGALMEAGAAAEGQAPELFGALAALVPKLISTVGPVLVNAIGSRLSPAAKKVVRRPIPRVVGGARPAAGMNPVLAQILQLLQGMQGREAEAETNLSEADEAVVSEAVSVIEAIVGTDDRIRVNATNQNPWRRICALRITFPSGNTYRGTGFLIGPRAVATAGHCVYMHSQGGWARKVVVIPGANGGDKPNGQVEATQFRSVGGWVNGRKPASDYGCIVLPHGSFGGRNLGNFAVGSFGARTLVAQDAVLAGYPGDKPFAELWGMKRRIRTVAAKTLHYDIDTMGGQSGAPVYIKRRNAQGVLQRYVVGIHNYGSSTGNTATRVTKPVATRLKAWSNL